MSPDGETLLVSTRINGRDTLSLVSVATGDERPLEFPPGVNEEAPSGNYAFSKRAFAADNRHALIYHASADTKGEIYVADVVAGTSRQLTRFSMASLDPARLPKSTMVTYRSFDGTAIGAVLTMPFNLKRDASNPAVVIPHGGPTGQAKDYFDRVVTALASRGYLVIQPNFRGSTGYGKAFQEANVKDLGGGDLRDVLAGKDFLVASGYVDARKVGIFGGSYGGFMTLMALGKYPDAFAAGVQWYGIINWNSMWETSDPFLREYMRKIVGDPEKDVELYVTQSPMTYLHRAKAPVLSLQGENDIRVPRQQAEEVAKLLKSSGVVAETTFYAEEGHGFNKRENEIDAIEKTVVWFEQRLKHSQ
jgi:dipeptidyl aminopeptidase/acylaminoacyl peptidase